MGNHRPRLLLKFGAISAFCLALLGVILIAELRSNTKEQALREAVTHARLVARLALQPELDRNALDRPVDAIEAARISALLADTIKQTDTPVTTTKVWNRDGRVVYSNEAAAQGRRFPISDNLQRALDGEEIAELGRDSHDGEAAEELVEVYVPLRFDDGGDVLGAFEVYVPYDRVAAAGQTKIRRTVLMLLAGFALLWFALYRIVDSASRSLRDSAELNRRLAREDALTGLANRTSFLELAGEALARKPTHAAVLLIDLDRFKDLNDSLGHHAGDLLLREIGPRLEEALPEGALVARLGGDEFAVLLAVDSREAAEKAADAARVSLAAPVEIEGIAVAAEGSVGIAMYPDDGEDVPTLVQRADVAMYEAKDKRVGVAYYQPDADKSSHERLVVLAQLREAIEREELVLYYQPKVLMSTGKIVGAEALVRWDHPDRGLLTPDNFVGLAEHTGLIGPLTELVLTRALRDTRSWWDAGQEIDVAVNLSVANLVDPGLPWLVARLLGETRLPPRALELEITESVLMTEPDRALRTLTLLRSMGVRLAVDDYGTGHSSLAYLHRLPLDTLKIDRSFISSISAEGGVIVRSTVELAHSLGLDVVAEGIEDRGTAAQLRALGCDLGQGFHFARPMPNEHLLQRLGGDPDPGFTATVSAFPQVRQNGQHTPVVGVVGRQPELVEDPADVLLDGALGDDQRLGDAGVAAAFRDQA